LLFFQRRASLKLPGWSRPENRSMDFPNVDQLIGAIVANKQATLHELQTVYTLEDAYDLFEIIAVTRYNEFLAIEDANKKVRK
jgi:hypothetical protein